MHMHVTQFQHCAESAVSDPVHTIVHHTQTRLRAGLRRQPGIRTVAQQRSPRAAAAVMAQEAQPWRRRLAQLSGQISGAAAAGASTTYSAISSLTAGQVQSVGERPAASFERHDTSCTLLLARLHLSCSDVSVADLPRLRASVSCRHPAPSRASWWARRWRGRCARARRWWPWRAPSSATACRIRRTWPRRRRWRPSSAKARPGPTVAGQQNTMRRPGFLEAAAPAGNSEGSSTHSPMIREAQVASLA